MSHIADAVSEGKADAVSAASVFHYGCLERFEYGEGEFTGEGNLEFLKRRTGTTQIPGVSISEVKSHLLENRIQTRPAISTDA